MVFCFGYGYVARFVGGIGTSRFPHGFGQYLYKGGSFPQEVLGALKQVDYVLFSIPPDESGDSMVSFVKEALASFIHLKWIGYLSSTSVYGDHQGAWVDESAEANPTTSRGLARLKAEKQWLTLKDETDLPIHIFRLAGIYGPARNVLEELKAGMTQRILKEGSVFSRIHVEDLVRALKASMQAPHPGRIYNIADNCPAPSHEVVAYGASLLGIDSPPLIPFEKASLTSMARSFYQESKRIKNDRLLKELLPSLLYPSYKEGLAALVKALA